LLDRQDRVSSRWRLNSCEPEMNESYDRQARNNMLKCYIKSCITSIVSGTLSANCPLAKD